MRRIVQYFLLGEILTILSLISLSEILLSALWRHPRAISGGAMGGGGLVRWWFGLWLGLLGSLKGLIGRYLREYHPGVYRWTRSLLVPRRRDER